MLRGRFMRITLLGSQQGGPVYGVRSWAATTDDSLKRGGGWLCRNNPLFTINSSCCSYTTALCFRFRSLTMVPVCCRHLIKILSVWPRPLFAAVDCSRVLYGILNLLWLLGEIPCFHQNEVYCHNRNLYSLETFKEV